MYDFIALCRSRALSFCRFLLRAPFFSIFLRITQDHYAFFSFFFLYPIRSRTTYLSHTSRLPVSLLHHYTKRFSWDLPSITNSVYFTWLVRIPNSLHYNLLIHVFNMCCTSHDFMHRICWSLGQIEGLCRYAALEIDESKIGTTRYNCGRYIEGQWVFGGNCLETGRAKGRIKTHSC